MTGIFRYLQYSGIGGIAVSLRPRALLTIQATWQRLNPVGSEGKITKESKKIRETEMLEVG